MSRIYEWFRQLARFWIAGMLLLVGLTMCFTIHGMCELSDLADQARTAQHRTPGDMTLGIQPVATERSALLDYQVRPTFGNCLYETIRLMVLDSPVSEFADHSHSISAARWLGATAWFSTVISVLIRLFRERALSTFVRWVTFFQGGHVVVAGLGKPEDRRERLALRLRQQGRDVVVIEPDVHHPGLAACRNAGVICLQGSAQKDADLERAAIHAAGTVVCLGDSDVSNADLLAAVVDRLNAQKEPHTDSKTPESAMAANEPEQPLQPEIPGNLLYFQQVNEPGLMEVLRRHRWHRDPSDRLHLRLFNQHEMAARTMLRETMIGREIPVLRKILLVGTGASGRMGEALVVRAIKDQRIECPDGHPLEIHVIDSQAEQWAQCLTGRIQFLGDVSGILPRNVPASKCGFIEARDWHGIVGEGFDAVFICLADEALAVTQATRVADAISRRQQLNGGRNKVIPIIVRVREEESGFGRLLLQRSADVQGCIRPVGLQDRVFDVIASMHPVVEMLAQVCHQDYLGRRQAQLRNATPQGAQKILQDKEQSLKSWSGLSERLRESNRELVRRFHGMLEVPDETGRIVRRFRMEFAPDEVIDPTVGYQLSDEELLRLARMEHDNWYATQYKAGWRYGEQDSETPPVAGPAALSLSDRLRRAADEHQRWLSQRRADGRPYSGPVSLRRPRHVVFNPNMTTWDNLSSEMKEFDFGIIRRMPSVLARADYKLVEV
ncbi:MAG: NAD-binding protein [Planctomycetaceae bacterium]